MPNRFDDVVGALPLGCGAGRLPADVPVRRLPIGTADRVALLRFLEVQSGGFPPGFDPPDRTLGEIEDLIRTRRENGAASVARPWIDRVSLATDKVSLRAIRAEDFADLYQAACDPAAGFRWRFRGATPPPEQFQRALFEGTLCHYAVQSGPVFHGAVFAYRFQQTDGHVFAAFQRLDARRQAAAGEMIEAMFLFLDYLFRNWPLRKVYFEMPGYNYTELLRELSGSGLVVAEGSLSDHLYHDGVYHPLHFASVHRDAFQGYVDGWEAIFAAPTER